MERTTSTLPLHSTRLLPRRIFNRLFAFTYSLAILALLYHHAKTLFRSQNSQTFFIYLSLVISDIILSFLWLCSQAFRMNPTIKNPFPENLAKILDLKDFPALDIFICTADPYKEPPIRVAATALSVMAYDYPVEKLSIYVSDDGGSELTLFALMEAAKFGKQWLPFCKENMIMDRCPDAFFRKNYASNFETQKIKMMFEKMKSRIEKVVEKGFITDEYKTNAETTAVFEKWTQGSCQDHPAVIQVLSQTSDDKDFAGHSMPNLIYVSRQKSKGIPHHFKAGALNVLFPVCFNELNKADIYGSELKRPFHINPMGLSGLLGPDYFGTGTFFSRRVFHGGPSSIILPEMPELSPDYIAKKCINSQPILELAHLVAGCNYENQTNWGSKIGFRYGSLVEDYYTGYLLHCEGWKSIFCNPDRPAFLSEMPISLNGVINQLKRWSVGLLEVVFSKHSPLTFGTRFLGPLMAHCYSYYAFGPIWPFPITVYALVPQVAMLNNVSIFPKVSDPWFFLYIFLFLGAYGQDCAEFILARSTFQRWWNDQRMWLIKGLSSDFFATLEYISNHLGIGTRGFDVTSKVEDNEQRKRYDEGKFEFGVASPMFVPLSTAAILNFVAFVWGIFQVLSGRDFDEFIVQMLIVSFGVVNCLPIYEAIALRRDQGRMPTKITIVSTFLAWILFVAFSFLPKMYNE